MTMLPTLTSASSSSWLQYREIHGPMWYLLALPGNLLTAGGAVRGTGPVLVETKWGQQLPSFSLGL